MGAVAKVKQVIVIRKDLNMRRGKEIAQGCHASTALFLDIIRGKKELTPTVKEWMEGGRKKICLQVQTEDQLLLLQQQCESQGVEAYLITDLGLTEFEGPTRTVLAIGPDLDERIDPITASLKLY